MKRVDEPTEWDVDHVAEWIASLGLPELIPNFVHNDIDGDILIHLDMETMIDIGVEKKEDRERISKEILTLTKHIERDRTPSETIDLHVSNKKRIAQENAMLQENIHIDKAKTEHEEILQNEKRKHENAMSEHIETLRETENEHVAAMRKSEAVLRETENEHAVAMKNSKVILREAENQHAQKMKEYEQDLRKTKNQHAKHIRKYEEALTEEKKKSRKEKEEHVKVSQAYANFMRVAEIRNERMMASQKNHHEVHRVTLLETENDHEKRRKEMQKNHEERVEHLHRTHQKAIRNRDEKMKDYMEESNQTISELRVELANARHELEDASIDDISKLRSQIIQYDNVVLGLEQRESRAMIAAVGHHKQAMREAAIEFEDKARHEIARLRRDIERHYRDEIEDMNRKASNEIELLTCELKNRVVESEEKKVVVASTTSSSTPSRKSSELIFKDDDVSLLSKIDLTLAAFETQYHEY